MVLPLDTSFCPDLLEAGRGCDVVIDSENIIWLAKQHCGVVRDLCFDCPTKSSIGMEVLSNT